MNDVYLNKSLIPKAGKGLFAKRSFKKGETIVEYTGKIYTWKEVRKKDGENAYLFFINYKTVLDPSRQPNMMAKYANDARGITKITGLRNNAEYVIRKSRCYIVAKRSIAAGEEILVAYGKEYWDITRNMIKEGSKQ